jgi:EmrB/QacA subfamily drug resistance transporter
LFTAQEYVKNYPNKWFAFMGIVLLSFGGYLDYTIVNVALPTIQQEFQINLIQLQWIMNIYFLTLCCLATIMGRCGDLYGRRKCFYIGVCTFTFASVLAGLAPTIHWLILGRLLQGVGAAMVFPLGLSLLPESFPPSERGKAIAWLGSMGGIALALGPVLGGLIVTHWGWRWIFFINVPLTLIGYLFCHKTVKESITENKINLDWQGMLLLAIALGGTVLGLIHGQTYGWIEPFTLIYLILGVTTFFLLIKVEKSQENPLINFGDFSNLLFYAGAMLCFLAGVLSAVALFFDPLYLQIIRGQSPQISGLVLFAIPIAVFIAASLVGKLIPQLGIINTILIGLFIACLSGLLQIFFISSTPLWYVIFSFICLGSLWAMGNTVPIIAAQTAVGPKRTSVASGTMVTMFSIGGSFGLALAVIIYNLVATKSLQLYQASFSNFTELAYLKKLILNPAHALQVQMNNMTHYWFNESFMHGFSAAMAFLLVISTLVFVSILIWKMKRPDYPQG